MKVREPSRRAVLLGGGALVVSFGRLSRLLAQEAGAKRPGSLSKTPFIDSWIRIDAQGGVTVFTGKAELGQGIKTAILQVAAEELDVAMDRIVLVTADTARTPDEGYTAGSQSMENSAVAVRHAAAQARAILITEAARRLDVEVEALHTADGVVIAADDRRLGYGDLVSDTLLHVEAEPQAPLKQPADFRVIGRPAQRIDIPAKVTGGTAYVQDLRLPRMLHGRIVRPSSPGARLVALDPRSVESLPGVVQVVRDGSFLGVVAEREWQAIKAMRALARGAQWDERATMPKPAELFATLERGVAEQGTVKVEGNGTVAGGKVLEATYTRPYQMHASIGPSCAVAQLDGETMKVWTHSQGVYPLRKALGELLGMPAERVHCIHVEGSGCYGHNGADDVAADAVLLARAVPGRPVRLQWMREHEHAGEPYGPAMIGKVRAGLDGAGRVSGWHYEVWSNIHSTRPGPGGNLLAARHVASPLQPEVPKLAISPAGNGDRNAVPLYAFASKRILWNFIPVMPLRVSALRALGAYLNVFALECFMDELAAEAGVDPVEFRLRHLEDPRARDVVSLAAEKFGWPGASAAKGGRGCGFGFARYKNLSAYCAVAAEVEVIRQSGRARLLRAVAAVDSGEIVNPDGIRNQIEGGILQALSWTLYESVNFDETRITSVDWASYPILRFNAVPEQVEVHIVPRPTLPFLGTGEASQGPAAAAVGNAIAHAIGKRLRDLPLTRERIKAAIEA